MSLLKSIPFEFEDQKYEIRIRDDELKIYIKAFLNNKPANGYTYQVDFPSKFYVENRFNMNLVEDFIKMAKDDILEKRWDKLLKLLQDNKKQTEKV